jgi:hypothetical protein
MLPILGIGIKFFAKIRSFLDEFLLVYLFSGFKSKTLPYICGLNAEHLH